MFTIQDLADGKCAVINDGTLEELRKVLNLAFPNDKCTIVGTGQYYFLNTNGKIKFNKLFSIWVGTGLKNSLPVQSVKDFLEEEFVLPNKWYFEVTKQNYEEFKHKRELVSVYGYITSEYHHNTGSWRYWRAVAPYGFTEITFEQFKKHVLKIKTEEKKEMKDKRFPFYLNPNDAQKIVDIACSAWKNKLAAMWASNIVLSKQLEITESFYKEMRSACTKEQHQLFDDIFGKDEPTYQYTDGELVWVKSGITRPWFLRYTTGKIAETGYLICYDEQRKSGTTTAWFGHQPAPGITLPD